MNCKISLTLSIVALMAIGTSAVQAHNVNLDLEYNNSSGIWELYAEIDANGTPDTNFGLASVRALIDNVDFGTFGVNTTGTTIASGIGALNPVVTTGGSTDPVLLTGGGTVDVLYGQDISASPVVAVVSGVGTPRELIASGTFAGIAPAFGDDDNGLTSDATFLNAAAGPFGNVVDADALVLAEIDVTPGGVLGDFEPDGDVDNDDLVVLLGNFGAFAGGAAGGDFEPDGDVDNDDLVVLLGNFTGPLPAVAAVPEPSSLLLVVTSLLLFGVRGRRSI